MGQNDNHVERLENHDVAKLLAVFIQKVTMSASSGKSLHGVISVTYVLGPFVINEIKVYC